MAIPKLSMAALLILTTLTCRWVGPAWAEQSSWSQGNLYDHATGSYYIPYELWTGADWDGSRTNRLHQADQTFQGHKTISGPERWIHPVSNKVYQIYRRLNGSKVQLFVIQERGFGRIYEQRRPGRERYFKGGVKFPAGPGWRLNETVDFEQKRYDYRRGSRWRCTERTLSVKITAMSFSNEGLLKSMTYDYFIDGDLNYTYRYEPGMGLVELTKGESPGPASQIDCE